MPMNKKVVMIFVKYPEPGKVKTRLARTLGFEKAAKIYRDLALENFNMMKGLKEHGVCAAVLYDPPHQEKDIRVWLSDADHYVAQRGAGLGERLENAFRELMGMGYESVFAMGSDTLNPDLDETLRGFELLDHEDAVVGPCCDGGYYALGIKEEIHELFKNIDWSTDKVLEQTLEKIKKLDLSYALLKEAEDLDEQKEEVMHDV